MNEVRIKIGLDGYSLTKQQVEDLDKAMKKLGTTIERQPGLARAILGGMGARPVPPVVGAGAPPVMPGATAGGRDWRTAMASLAISPFSPWVASRGLSQVFGPLIGGGGGSGIGNRIWGPGGFSGFLQWLLLLEYATRGLTMAFQELVHAVERGAKLYEQSAEVGKQPGSLFRLQQTVGPLGISADQLTRLMVRGENPLISGGRTMRMSDAVLGAGRGVMQMGELQRLSNLREYIDLLDKEVGVDSSIMQRVSQGLFNLKVEWGQLTREWNTLWSEIADSIGQVLILVMKNFREQLQGLNAFIDMFGGLANILFTPAGSNILKLLSGYPTSGLNNLQTGGFGEPGREHLSAWERMGFVIGQGGIGDYAQQTAENTKEIANNTSKAAELLEKVWGMPASSVYAMNNLP